MNTNDRPFRVGQKVTVRYSDDAGPQASTAYVSLAHPLPEGMFEFIAITGHGRAISHQVPSNGDHDRLTAA